MSILALNNPNTRSASEFSCTKSHAQQSGDLDGSSVGISKGSILKSQMLLKIKLTQDRLWWRTKDSYFWQASFNKLPPFQDAFHSCMQHCDLGIGIWPRRFLWFHPPIVWWQPHKTQDEYWTHNQQWITTTITIAIYYFNQPWHCF